MSRRPKSYDVEVGNQFVYKEQTCISADHCCRKTCSACSQEEHSGLMDRSTEEPQLLPPGAEECTFSIALAAEGLFTIEFFKRNGYSTRRKATVGHPCFEGSLWPGLARPNTRGPLSLQLQGDGVTQNQDLELIKLCIYCLFRPPLTAIALLTDASGKDRPI